jgi:hypothetical protein
MLRDCPHTRYMKDIWHIESLSASIVVNVPYFYHALSVASYERIQIRGAVNTHQRRLVAIQSNDVVLTVGIPDKD